MGAMRTRFVASGSASVFLSVFALHAVPVTQFSLKARGVPRDKHAG